jgi:hypothetical protein
MKRSSSIADAAFSAAESVASQPALFDASAIPLDLELGQAAARLCHSGRITERNEARAMAIAACKLAGLSDRETAARVGCSRNTVPAVMEQLETSGRIPGLSARLAVHLGRVAESAALELQRIIDSGEWDMESSSAVRALGVAMGIATEKLQLVTGQATAIVEQRTSGPDPAAVREWEAKLRAMFGPVLELQAPADSESGGKLLSCKALEPFATHSAQAHGPPGPPRGSAAAPEGQGGGGGSPPPRRARGTMHPTDSFMEQVSEEAGVRDQGPAGNGFLFTVHEDQLRAAIGLSREQLRAARKLLTRGVDWEVRGHRVCWTENAAGSFALLQQPVLGPPVPENLGENVATPPLNGVEPFWGEAQVLVVTAWNFPNRRVIHCVPVNGAGAIRAEGPPHGPVAVRVQDSQLFRNGMRILARPAPAGSAWEYLGNPERPASAGPRYPRHPGAW